MAPVYHRVYYMACCLTPKKSQNSPLGISHFVSGIQRIISEGLITPSSEFLDFLNFFSHSFQIRNRDSVGVKLNLNQDLETRRQVF